MKILKNALLCFAMLCFTLAFSQDNPPKMFVVHQDHVTFDKMGQYEEAAKQLKEACDTHNIEGMNWNALATEDGRYLYVTEIENMAQLDDNSPWKNLSDAMGADKFSSMMDKMDECYTHHNDHIVYHAAGLSYWPEGYSVKDKNFRELHFLYYKPNKSKDLYESLKGVKKMFEDKGSKMGYNVYRSGFGSPENYYVVVISGEDKLDVLQRGKANDDVLGDDRKAVFYNMIKNVGRYQGVDADYRPDLSRPKS